MADQDDHNTLARNTIAQSAPLLLGYVLSFVSAPIIVGSLGLTLFGVWALTGALAKYGALLDLGIGSSLSRFIALHRSDRAMCGQLMAVGWIAAVLITVFLSAVAALLAGVLHNAVHVLSIADLRIVLASTVVLFSAANFSGVVSAYPIGLNRMVKPNVGIAIGAVINFVASVGSLLLGAGLPGYAIANAGAAVVSLFVIVGIVVHAEGVPPLSRPRLSTARTFLSFAVKNQVIRLMNLVNYETDKIVIALAVSPAAAGAYELANRVALAAREVGVYATSALNIHLTTMLARSGIARVRSRYGRLTAVTATIGLPPVVLAMATAPLLLEAWLGQAPPNSVIVLVALCAAYLLSVPTATNYGVAAAAGRPGFIAWTAVGTAAVNIVLTVGLAPLFGLWGVLTGTVVALGGGAILQILIAEKQLDLPASEYFAAVFPALRAFGLLAIPVAIICYGGDVDGRAIQLVVLIAVSVAYLIGCGRWAKRAGRLPDVVTRRIPAFARLLLD